MPTQTQADAQAAKDARGDRGGTVDRQSVQVIANLAHHIHTRAVTIERQIAGDRVVASVAQAEDIDHIASQLANAASLLRARVLTASGLSADENKPTEPVSSSADARSDGAIHEVPRDNDRGIGGVATHPDGPTESSDAA